MRNNEFEARKQLFLLQTDRISPTTSAYVPESLKQEYKTAVDEYLKRTEDLLLQALKNEEYSDADTDYPGIPPHLLIIHFAAVMLPAVLVFAASKLGGGMSARGNQLLSELTTRGYLFVLFFIPALITAFLAKAEDGRDGSGVIASFVKWISFAVMFIFTLRKKLLFGSPLNWIVLYMIINFVLCVFFRLNAAKDMGRLRREADKAEKRYRETVESVEEQAGLIDEIVSDIDAIYAEGVEQINREYKTAFAFQPSFNWWDYVIDEAKPWRRSVPRGFSGTKREIKHVVDLDGSYDYYTGSSWDMTKTDRVENFETQWVLISAQTAQKLVSRDFEPLWELGIDEWDNTKYEFILRGARWETYYDTYTEHEDVSYHTEADKERQEAYRRSRRLDDIAYFGQTMDALEYSGDLETSWVASTANRMRDEYASTMTKTTVEHSFGSEESSEKRGEYRLLAGFVVAERATKSLVAVYYNKALDIESMDFFFDFLSDGAKTVPHYELLTSDKDSARTISKAAALSLKKYQNAYTFKKFSGYIDPRGNVDEIWE